MSRDSTLNDFSRLKQEAGAAPHKPLLALFALSHWIRNRTVEFPFREIEHPLGELIRDPAFGAAPTATARDPFWFLCSDGVWVVEWKREFPLPEGRPTLDDLRAGDARGRFATHIAADLDAMPGLAVELFGRILCLYIDPAHHRKRLDELGV
jgi:putative restriction endonuclease